MRGGVVVRMPLRWQWKGDCSKTAVHLHCYCKGMRTSLPPRQCMPTSCCGHLPYCTPVCHSAHLPGSQQRSTPPGCSTLSAGLFRPKHHIWLVGGSWLPPVQGLGSAVAVHVHRRLCIGGSSLSASNCWIHAAVVARCMHLGCMCPAGPSSSSSGCGRRSRSGRTGQSRPLVSVPSSASDWPHVVWTWGNVWCWCADVCSSCMSCAGTVAQQTLLLLA